MVRMGDAPTQFCPECGFELKYLDTKTEQTEEGELERFDYYECENGHGKFQFRHFDRILRKVS